MPGHLIIRADASPQIGVGHVMRCLALAHAWIDAGGAATLAAAELPPHLAARLAREGVPVAMLAQSADATVQTLALAQASDARWIVLDGYHLGAAAQQRFRAAGHRVLFVDDNADAADYCADLVLNQNLHADEALYGKREPHTRLLLGTKFSLLRREFSPWRGRPRGTPEFARKILITMGGSDPDNVTAQVLDAIEGSALAADVECAIVAGAANPHLASLRFACERRPGWELIHDAPDMPALMAAADVAISASGSTSWELAFMGLPALMLVLAENQRELAAQLDAREVGIAVRELSSLAPALEKLAPDQAGRARMTARGRELVDGFGAARVVAAMEEIES